MPEVQPVFPVRRHDPVHVALAEGGQVPSGQVLHHHDVRLVCGPAKLVSLTFHLGEGGGLGRSIFEISYASCDVVVWRDDS